MKILLGVLSALLLVAVLVFAVVIGFDWKHNPVERADRQAAEIEKLIQRQHVPDRAAIALRRIEKNVVMHASLAGTLMTGSIVELLKADNVITDAQVTMIEDAARMLERSDISRKDAQAFFERHQDVFPHAQHPAAGR